MYKPCILYIYSINNTNNENTKRLSFSKSTRQLPISASVIIKTHVRPHPIISIARIHTRGSVRPSALTSSPIKHEKGKKKAAALYADPCVLGRGPSASAQLKPRALQREKSRKRKKHRKRRRRRRRRRITRPKRKPRSPRAHWGNYDNRRPIKAQSPDKEATAAARPLRWVYL